MEPTVARIEIPDRARAVMLALEAAGGRPRLVGGMVRDQLLAQLGRPVVVSKDVDIEVHGLSLFETVQALETAGRVDQVGVAFGVLKVTVDGGEQIDVSLPRRESKLRGELGDRPLGHRGFWVETDPALTLAEAASRRDFTINTMSADTSGAVADPFNGLVDLRDGWLRATSEHFAEDPLRVLRGIQFAARFGLRMDEQTVALCQRLLPEFATLSAERVWGELSKLVRAPHVLRGLQLLEATGWLAAFPELHALSTTRQDPEWHPEGNVWTHSQLAADQASWIARREGLDGDDTEVLVLAALLHDVGKPATTEERDGHIISHGHAEAGAAIAREFLSRLRAPGLVVERVGNLVREHMIHTGAQPTGTAVRRLARRLGPDASIRLLALVVEADASGRFPAPPASPMTAWVEAAERLHVADDAPRPLLLGRHLIDAGMLPGREFGDVLRAALEAQLEGEFTDLDGALAWLAHRPVDVTRS